MLRVSIQYIYVQVKVYNEKSTFQKSCSFQRKIAENICIHLTTGPDLRCFVVVFFFFFFNEESAWDSDNFKFLFRTILSLKFCPSRRHCCDRIVLGRLRSWMVSKFFSNNLSTTVESSILAGY